MDKQVLNYLSNMYTPETDNVEEVGEEITVDGMTVLAEATSFYDEKEVTKVDMTLSQAYIDYLSDSEDKGV